MPSLLRSSLLVASSVLLAACSSPAPGGPVEGAADAHCGTTVQATDPAVCMMTGTAPPDEDHPVLFGTEGDDDDCKYHVTWSSTDVYENQDVTFTVTVTNKTDGKPTTGAMPYAEVFLSDTHPAPNTDANATESPAGTYAIGPIRFDAAGRWTVRYHFFHDCTDVSEESPHAHVAFYVDVP
jgi:hypothetical protein